MKIDILCIRLDFREISYFQPTCFYILSYILLISIMVSSSFWDIGIPSAVPDVVKLEFRYILLRRDLPLEKKFHFQKDFGIDVWSN